MENTANSHLAHDPGPNDSQTKLTSEANAPGRRQSSDKESTLVESSPGLEYSESPVPERRNDGQAMYMEYSEEDGDEKQEPEYLKSWKLVLVMTGISLVIFCMSLVRTGPSYSTGGRRKKLTDGLVGQYYSGDGDSQDYRSVQLFG